MKFQLKSLNHTDFKGPKYSWKKVFLVLIISSSVTTGVGIFGLFFFLKHRDCRLMTVQSLIQTAQNGILLPALFFEEVLDLSEDQKTGMEQLSLARAEEKLLATGIMQKVALKKVKPHSLLIEYRVRKPLFFLKDYSNTVMDAEGFFFPFAPFFSPQKLPQLYLGGNCGQSLDPKVLKVIEEIIANIGFEEIEQIDLSKIMAQKAGHKEIVLFLKNKMIVRLSLWNLNAQLQNFQILLQNRNGSSELNQLFEVDRIDSLIIDLRLSDLAFIEKVIN